VLIFKFDSEKQRNEFMQKEDLQVLQSQLTNTALINGGKLEAFVFP